MWAVTAKEPNQHDSVEREELGGRKSNKKKHYDTERTNVNGLLDTYKRGVTGDAPGGQRCHMCRCSEVRTSERSKTQKEVQKPCSTVLTVLLLVIPCVVVPFGGCGITHNGGLAKYWIVSEKIH